MTTAIWWMSRHWAPRVLILGAITAGIAAGWGVAYTPEDAVAQAFDAGRVICLFLGPLVLSAMWSSLHGARAEETRHLAGWATVTQRTEQMVAHLVLLGLAVALTTVITAALLLARLEPYPYGAFPQTSLLRAGSSTVLAVVGIVTVTTVLCRGRSTAGALSVAAGLVLVHLTCLFSSGIPGSLLLRELWPGTGSLIISEAGRNYTTAQAVIAGVVLTGWAVAACVSCVMRPRGRSDGGGGGVVLDGQRSRVPAAAAVVGPLLLAAILPSGLSHLPAQVSPALLLQRSEAVAPDQVTEAFFFALRSQGREGARRFAAPEFEVGRLPGFFARDSPNESFLLESVSTLTKAEVRADIAAGTYFACLRYGDSWKIVRLSTQRCPR